MSSLGKSKRTVDKKLLEEIRSQPCVCCGEGPCDPDHIKTHGSGGHDVRGNLWALCRPCHTEKGILGLTSFVNRHPHLESILISKGWTFDTFRQKWLRSLH